TARLWDVETGKPVVEPLPNHKDRGWDTAFSPDGSRRIVTSLDHRTPGLRDADTGKPVGEPLRGHADFVFSAVFSPDGKRIVTASADTTARLWEVASGRETAILRGHEASVNSAAFSPDGSALSLRLWTGRLGYGTPRPASKSASRW